MPINMSMTQAMLTLIQENRKVLSNVLTFQGALEAVIIDGQYDQAARSELEERLNSLIQEIQNSRDVLYALLEGLGTPSNAQQLAVEQLIQLLIDTDTELITGFNQLLQELLSGTQSPGDFVSWMRDAIETTADSVKILLSAHERSQVVTTENFFPPSG